MPESNFSALDWTIVAFYLLGTVLIGFYVNRRIRGMSDFLVAGRSIRTRLGIATMIGSELGLVTAMFAAQKGFTGGFAAFHIGVLALVAALVVGFTGMIVVPLREMKVMTIPEFYEKRFSRKLRIFGGLILALSGILNMGLFLKAGAIFVTGLTRNERSDYDQNRNDGHDRVGAGLHDARRYGLGCSDRFHSVRCAFDRFAGCGWVGDLDRWMVQHCRRCGNGAWKCWL